MRMRVVVITLPLVTLFGVGCGEPKDLSAPMFPSEPCSELARSVYDAQGLEQRACGAVTVEQRELIALGEGYILEWVPTSGRHRIWAIGDDLTLGTGPVLQGGKTPAGAGHLLYSLGGRRMLDVQPLSADWAVLSVDLHVTRSGSNALQPTMLRDRWPGPALFWGHEILALDDGYVLKWRPGDGQYEVDLHDVSTDHLVPTGFQGQANALKRGARLVNLGAHRMLEWLPVTGEYRIWPYHFTDGDPSIFATVPSASGTWSDLGRRHDILVVDDQPRGPTPHLVVWDRDTGDITISPLDPLADNPRAPSGVTSTYAHLQSLDWNPPTQSKIQNVVAFFQRGRSFDSYFGQYCQGLPGDPPCEDGPACCERMPAAIPGADHCTPIDATLPDLHVPDDSVTCMKAKMDGGAMDAYASASCGSPADFACVRTDPATGLVALAATGALGDRGFQSTILGDGLNAEINAIYLSAASWGSSVKDEGGHNQLTFLMSQADVRYAIYVDNPGALEKMQMPPEFYDAHWTPYRGLDELERDIALDQLGDLSIVFTPPALSEQPGHGAAQAGIDFVTRHVELLARSSRYQPTTLTLLTYLSTGGFYDHVQPPPPWSVLNDSQFDQTDPSHPMYVPVPFGPRVPFLALGNFVRPGHVSHVPIELSSVVAFLEWNWLGGKVGQLQHRDAVTNNLGDLLDPAKTGAVVPIAAPAP